MKPYINGLSTCLIVLVFLSGCGSTSSSVDGASNSGSGGTTIGGAGGGTKGDAQALVSWTPPTQNSDGSALTDLAGFRIYYGNSPGNYQNSIAIDTTAITSFMVENLAIADWYFAITAVNSSGIESAYSDEVYFRPG